jgi:hypothetical protein
MCQAYKNFVSKSLTKMLALFLLFGILSVKHFAFLTATMEKAVLSIQVNAKNEVEVRWQ